MSNVLGFCLGTYQENPDMTMTNKSVNSDIGYRFAECEHEV